MRLIFYDIKNNPFLLKTFDNLKNRVNLKLNKDGLILRDAIDNGYVICNLLPENSVREKIKVAYTLKKNGIKVQSIINIFDESQIQPDDIFFAWYYFPKHMECLKTLVCKKVVMGQHFIRLPYNTNFDEFGVDYFVNQVDVSDNDFVKKYFKLSNVQMVSLPYTYEKRFEVRKDFRQRKKKALSIGTIATLNGRGYDIYLEYKKTACCQPMRKLIYDNGNNDCIDVKNSYIFKPGIDAILTSSIGIIDYLKYKKSNKEMKMQKDYYSYDIVDKYNEYMMCICAEEGVGLPGIGFVESMSCGCAYIGLDNKIYTNLGMIPGIHYITYNGTYDDLVRVIKYYQNNLDELEIIANNGKDFVRERLNEKRVMSDFWKEVNFL